MKKTALIRYAVIITGFFFLFLLSANVLLYKQQPDFVFYPLKEIMVTPGDWGMHYEKVILKDSRQQKISGWFIPHEGAEYTVLFFHGNGGNISHRGDSLAIFKQLGFNTLIIDYPGYGESEGDPTEQGLYSAADAAWNYLINQRKLKAENIIIFGRSLGGAVAVHLAKQVNAAALILESTFSSVRDIVDIAFPVLSDLIYLRYSFDSENKKKEVNSPILFIHSPEDEVIPYELGQKLFRAASSEKYFMQTKGGHNNGFIESMPGYALTIHEFVQSL